MKIFTDLAILKYESFTLGSSFATHDNLCKSYSKGGEHMACQAKFFFGQYNNNIT